MTVRSSTFHTVRACLGALLLTCASFGLSAATAHADDDSDDGDGDSWARFMLGVDLDYVFAATLDSINAGGGGALRVGSELDLMVVTLIPEGYFSYHTFDGSDLDVMSGRLGGRLRIGKIVEPGIFAHVGVAHVDGVAEYTAPALDGGVTLDVTVIPLIDIGVHAAYDAVLRTAGSPPFSHATFGLHAALVL